MAPAVYTAKSFVYPPLFFRLAAGSSNPSSSAIIGVIEALRASAG